MTEVTVYDGGEMVSVGFSASTSRPLSRGRRGQVKTFSKSSRRNLLRTIGKLNCSERVYFVTLTYPAVFPKCKQAKRHLDTFGKRLIRRLPTASFVWRLEWQKRGAPHFHLLVFGLPLSAKAARRYVSRIWYETVGSLDENHLKAGVQLDKMRSWRGVMAYCSKYVAKVGPILEDSPGRLWGAVNRVMLPCAIEVVVTVSMDLAYRVGVLLAQASGYRPLFLGRRYWHIPKGVVDYVHSWIVSAGEPQSGHTG